MAEQHFIQATVKKPTLEQAQYWLNEIRIEKETKNLLAGTSSRQRPEMEAPAGALPSNTKFAATQVTEQRISANDLLGIQQTAAQQPNSAPRTGVAPATNNLPPASRSANVINPFATGTALPTINSALTPQQLEQLRNQR